MYPFLIWAPYSPLFEPKKPDESNMNCLIFWKIRFFWLWFHMSGFRGLNRQTKTKRQSCISKKRLTDIHLYINLKIKHSHKAAILQVQLCVEVPCDALNHAKLFNHWHITNCTFSLLEGVGLVGDRGAVWVAFGSLATPTGTSGTELSLLSFTGPAFWSFGSAARSAVRGERGGRDAFRTCAPEF